MIDIRFEELNIDRYKQMIEWCNEHFGRAAIWASQLDKPAGVATWYSNNNYDKNKFTGDKMETGRARLRPIRRPRCFLCVGAKKHNQYGRYTKRDLEI